MAELKVGGLTPFSATDYPGKLAAVVFVQGCPWRCGYCHNPHLQARTPEGAMPWQEVLTWLRRRVGLVDAVVFSGGEACMDSALARAMQDARALGFGIGLHTACIYPQRLQEVLPLVDWVGFDIKAPFADYRHVTRVAGSGDPALACLDAKGVDNYVLQQFRAEGCADAALAGRPLHGYPAADTVAQIGAMFPRFTFRNHGS